jgi:transglutaminase-like putative cysteine protease
MCIAILIWWAKDYGLLKTMINLLVVACCLKILNLHFTGDYQMVASIQLFLIGCGLIFHQNLAYSLFYCSLIIMLFCALHAIKIRETTYTLYTKQTLLLIAQAVPIAIILFFVTPKLTPLWKMPVAKSSQTGLSESMTPGDIASLAKSDELVFRAEFKGELPAPNERYWRAIVLDEFDGKTWSIAEKPKRYPLPSEVTFTGKALDYVVIAEPTSTNWLYSLDIPVIIQSLSTQGMSVNQQFQLQTKNPLHAKGLYVVKSFVEQALNIYKGYEDTARYLQIPNRGNNKTVNYVLNNISPSMSTREKLNRLNSVFADNDFTYSLSPPLMQQNPIDQFLFEDRIGFCSHYASALTYMLRLANVPARIVTGYQGGEVQSENVISVHQYDAHAWVEAWDDELGWIRSDPTAIVAPNRVLSGLLSSAQNREEFRSESPFSLTLLQDYTLFNDLRLLLAEIDHSWSQSVLRYSQESQRSLLKKIFGDMTERSFFYVLIGSFIIIGLFIAILFIPRNRIKRNAEQKWLLKLYKLLSRQGYTKQEHETLQQFYDRIASHLNQQTRKALQFVINQYYQWQYNTHDKQTNFSTVETKTKKQMQVVKQHINDK